MLRLRDLTAGYGQSTILRGVSLDLAPGSVTCLLGRNGVGKTTLLKSIVGLLPVRRGQVLFDELDLTGASTAARARAGIGYVPQGRGIFPHLTVLENLLMGFETHRSNGPEALDEVYQLFPVLQSMGARAAGRLSGGQQQQLALARALVGRPRVLLLDEPTEGIQPSVIWEIERAIEQLRSRSDLSILLVEQFVEFAIDLADAYYLMDRGTIVANGPAADLTEEVVRQHLAV
jgi:urea transport system ATP-binding protein